jgi:hypothetical protein
MKQLVDFFEAILVALATYPATIGYTLFAPRKLFDSESRNIVCPASLAVVISVYLYWFAERILDEVLYRGIIKEIGFANFLMLTMTLIAVAILIMLVRIILRTLFGLSAKTGDPVEELRILSYPLGVGLVVSAMVTILAINFPDATLWLAPHLDKESAAVLADVSLNVRFHLSAGVVTALPVVFLSAWALFNVIRVGFNATVLRSLVATFTSIIIASVLVIVFVFAMDHTTKMLDRLYGKPPISQEGTHK